MYTFLSSLTLSSRTRVRQHEQRLLLLLRLALFLPTGRGLRRRRSLIRLSAPRRLVLCRASGSPRRRRWWRAAHNMMQLTRSCRNNRTRPRRRRARQCRERRVRECRRWRWRRGWPRAALRYRNVAAATITAASTTASSIDAGGRCGPRRVPRGLLAEARRGACRCGLWCAVLGHRWWLTLLRRRSERWETRAALGRLRDAVPYGPLCVPRRGTQGRRCVQGTSVGDTSIVRADARGHEIWALATALDFEPAPRGEQV